MRRATLPLGPLAVLLLTSCAGPDLPNLQTVEPGLLLRAGQPSALGLAHLRDRHGVRTVVNLSPATADQELAAALALGLDYVPLPTRTYAIERDHLVAVLAAIRQAEAEGRAPVLVHCRTGQDRTGTAVALFRTLEQGWEAEAATAEMERYRHWTHEALFPHLPGVVHEAEDFEAVWREAVARTGHVPVVRPPAPWSPADAPAEAVAVEVTTEPGVL